ncbi:ATP-binding protein [Actinomadura hibisca]|uniref:ATP-binding protein n=1 Tax=Actinomadura hibisca TaxID=68565 RepID=UPI00082C21FC|nr:tetratricopeptide repeat protein [Actinomadura hibisca]
MDGPWRPWDDLPAEASSFVGRARELRAVRDALERVRLVTLTGPGGVGKTRLALRAARDAALSFPGGVHLVELSGLRDGALLPDTVAEAMGLRDSMAGTPLELLAGFLRDRRALLILDTCEHLVAESAALAGTLLAGCPELRLLVTSRQPLDVPGEEVLVVPPLAVPDEPDGPQGAADAVALFAARAAEAVPGFTVTRANRDRVELLCRRLDGIPLAIELAAVRLRSLSLDRLVRRLDVLFWVLDNGPSELTRHQALRTTVGWSHELCAPHERLLWARLSVFAGGFDAAMAEEVCADDRLDRVEVAEHLAGLAEKSIVQRAGPGRYVMLDTVREYGAAWLEAVEDARPLRVRHRDCMTRLASRASAAWLTDGQYAWVRRMEGERDNLRVGLEFCFTAGGEGRAGLRLATALFPAWMCVSRFTEGRYWLDRGLAAVREPCPERVEALWQAAYFRTNQGESPTALPLLAEAIKLAERTHDAVGYARAQRTLGTAATFMGDAARAERCFDEALEVFLEAGLRNDLIMLRVLRGFHRARTGASAAALAECAEAGRLLADAPQECWIRAWAGYVRALAHWFQDEADRCAAELRSCLAMFRRMEDPVGLTNSFELLGWVFARQRRFAEGAILLGAAARYPAQVGVPRLGDAALESQHRELEAQARAALGGDAFARHHGRGRSLTLDETVRFACGDLPAT